MSFKKSDENGPYYYDENVGRYGAIMKDNNYHELAFAIHEKDMFSVVYMGGPASSQYMNKIIIKALNEYWDEDINV